MVTTLDAKPTAAHNTAQLLDEDTLISRSRILRHSRVVETRYVEIRIRGISHHVVLMNGCPIVLGRADDRCSSYPDIDLTQYAGEDHNISHEHARLMLYHGHVFIIDLPGSNGTYKGGRRLIPHDPELLDDGDAVVLGGLPIQIRFVNT